MLTWRSLVSIYHSRSEAKEEDALFSVDGVVLGNKNIHKTFTGRINWREVDTEFIHNILYQSQCYML